MRGIDTCYLCGGSLEDRLNRFNASGLLTHHVCPMRDFPYTGRTRSGHALHLWGAGRTACGRDASKAQSSVASVSCQRCVQSSRRELFARQRATR